MIRIRHIAANWTQKETSILELFDIKISPGFKSFTLAEDDKYRELMKKLTSSQKGFLAKSGLKDFRDILVSAKFSEEELQRASYFWLQTENFGYPFPKIINKYRKQVFQEVCLYNKSENCCGYHGKQKAPFFIDAIPKTNVPNLLFSLHWEQDTLFTTKELYEEFFKRKGFEVLDVYLKSNKNKLNDLVQLKLSVSPFSLNLRDSDLKNTLEKCPCCGHARYGIRITDFMPPFTEDPNIDFFLTQETFGSGGETFRRICISNSFLKELKAYYKIKDHNLIPSYH